MLNFKQTCLIGTAGERGGSRNWRVSGSLADCADKAVAFVRTARGSFRCPIKEEHCFNWDQKSRHSLSTLKSCRYKTFFEEKNLVSTGGGLVSASPSLREQIVCQSPSRLTFPPLNLFAEEHEPELRLTMFCRYRIVNDHKLAMP